MKGQGSRGGGMEWAVSRVGGLGVGAWWGAGLG